MDKNEKSGTNVNEPEESNSLEDVTLDDIKDIVSNSLHALTHGDQESGNTSSSGEPGEVPSTKKASKVSSTSVELSEPKKDEAKGEEPDDKSKDELTIKETFGKFQPLHCGTRMYKVPDKMKEDPTYISKFMAAVMACKAIEALVISSACALAFANPPRSEAALVRLANQRWAPIIPGFMWLLIWKLTRHFHIGGKSFLNLIMAFVLTFFIMITIVLFTLHCLVHNNSTFPTMAAGQFWTYSVVFVILLIPKATVNVEWDKSWIFIGLVAVISFFFTMLSYFCVEHTLNKVSINSTAHMAVSVIPAVIFNSIITGFLAWELQRIIEGKRIPIAKGDFIFASNHL